ncbi:MAG TPA: DUF72 domain-containing protein [Gemmatimonadota bacterium]|jgi:uncharacterized protein YecE (DUF72 family)
MAHRIGACTVRFGIAGWSYPDWEGIVYPPATRDRLRWLAGLVDLIEVNSTFYSPVAPRTAADWAARTADLPDFRFAAKAHRSFTHDASETRASDARAFARGLEPLRESGRFVALLFQFPFGFRDVPAARDRLRRLADAFAEWPKVVEVRHRTWANPEALAFLGSLGFSVANLDYPVGSDGFGEEAAVTGEPGYLRLHGRNAADWFRPDAGRDARYDYLYDDDELDELSRRIEELAGRFRELVIVTNNHYRGQALANVAELAARAGAAPRPLPDTLIRTYPRLAAFAPALPAAARLPVESPIGGGGAVGATRGPGGGGAPGAEDGPGGEPSRGHRRPRPPAAPGTDAQRDLFET